MKRVLIILAVVLALLFSGKAGAVNVPVGWNYYEPITIGNQNSINYQSPQVLITLNASNFPFSLAKVDGGDIRFIDESGSTLPYYIETWNYTDSTAVIWVRLPTLQASILTTIYIIFGNQAATYAGDKNSVFYFYDGGTRGGWIKYGAGIVSYETSIKYAGNWGIQKNNYCDPNGAYVNLPAFSRTVALVFYVRRDVLPGCNWDRVGVIDTRGNGFGIGLDANQHKLFLEKRVNYNGTLNGSIAAPYSPHTWYKVSLILAPGKVIGILYNGNNAVARTTWNVASFSTFNRVYIFGGYPYYVDEMTLLAYYPTPLLISYGSYSKVANEYTVTVLDQNSSPVQSPTVEYSTTSVTGNPAVLTVQPGIITYTVYAPGYNSTELTATIVSDSSTTVTLYYTQTPISVENTVALPTGTTVETTVIDLNSSVAVINSTSTVTITTVVYTTTTVYVTTTINYTETVSSPQPLPVLSTANGTTYYETSSVTAQTNTAAVTDGTAVIGEYVVSSTVYWALAYAPQTTSTSSIVVITSASGGVIGNITLVTPTNTEITSPVGKTLTTVFYIVDAVLFIYLLYNAAAIAFGGASISERKKRIILTAAALVIMILLPKILDWIVGA